jgi:hypothetical protein
MLPTLLGSLALTSALVLIQTPAASQGIVQQGRVISLNGRQFPVAWSQWQEGDRLHTGISDTGARQLFGLNFASTNTPNSQPITWFSLQNLPAKFIAPYRYLDVTDLLAQAGATFSITGSTLTLVSPGPRVQNLSIEHYGAVQRLIIQLDRPTFWQVSQVKNEGIISIEGMADPALLSRFQPVPVSTDSANVDEDDLGTAGNTSIARAIALENVGTMTRLKLSLPTAYGLQITSVAHPNRIVIDVRPDPIEEKRIVWQEGLIWNQKYLPLQQDWFPVTWLEIEPKSVRFILRPIAANSTSSLGTSPLVTISSSQEALAAINGGFFNRNNQLPLGALRVQGRWLSGPILDRGAIAWDDRGNFAIGRLQLLETLISSTGQRFSLTSLNSAYLESGLSRYTRDWGTQYTPLTAGETVISIEGDRVTTRSNNASKQAIFSIPENGYLIIARKTELPLGIGDVIRLDSETNPPNFANYSQIIGAGPLLLANGRIVLAGNREKFSQAFQEQRASRSAIALTREGKVLLVALHNRVAGKGATLAEFAQILQGMGAVSALNLDGGSSTGIVLGGHLIDRDPVTAAKVHNGIGIFVSPSP